MATHTAQVVITITKKRFLTEFFKSGLYRG
jgi:hypothetical protein